MLADDPRASARTPIRWVPVVSARHHAELGFLVSVLHGEDIPTRFHWDPGLYGTSARWRFGAQDILVPEDRVAEACGLLDACERRG